MGLSSRMILPVVLAISSCLPRHLARRLDTTTHSAEFGRLNPILQELGGKEPVPEHDIFLVPSDKIREFCSGTACYKDGGEIYVSEDYIYDIPRVNYKGYRCPGSRDTNIPVRSMFEVILHEQGHHFDLDLKFSKSGKWIDQLEAVAYEYYVAEFIALNHERELGLQLMVNSFARYPTAHKKTARTALGQVEEVGSISKFKEGSISCWDGELANASIDVLLGSGFSSFGEVWHYVHSTDTQEIITNIESHYDDATLTRGKNTAEKILITLAGHNPDGYKTDFSFLANLDLGDFTKIEKLGRGKDFVVKFSNYQITFSADVPLTIAIEGKTKVTGKRQKKNGEIIVENEAERELTIDITDNKAKSTHHTIIVNKDPDIEYCESKEQNSVRSLEDVENVRAAFDHVIRSLAGHASHEQIKFANSLIAKVFEVK